MYVCVFWQSCFDAFKVLQKKSQAISGSSTLSSEFSEFRTHTLCLQFPLSTWTVSKLLSSLVHRGWNIPSLGAGFGMFGIMFGDSLNLYFKLWTMNITLQHLNRSTLWLLCRGPELMTSCRRGAKVPKNADASRRLQMWIKMNPPDFVMEMSEVCWYFLCSTCEVIPGKGWDPGLSMGPCHPNVLMLYAKVVVRSILKLVSQPTYCDAFFAVPISRVTTAWFLILG